MKYSRKEITPPPSAPLWYVTFSDMMTLLFGCFVLMLSFSTLSSAQFDNATRSLNGALGTWQGTQQAPDSRPNEPKEAQALHDAAREFRRQLQVAGRADEVAIAYEERALKLTFTADRLFKPDSSGLEAAAIPILALVDTVIGVLPRASVRISGHGDGTSLELLDKYAANVAESYDLARMVYAALREMPGGIDARHPVIEGSGDANSIATAGSEEGRRKNRRVEIVVRTDAPAVS